MSQQERGCVFRCAALVAHFLIAGGIWDEKEICFGDIGGADAGDYGAGDGNGGANKF